MPYADGSLDSEPGPRLLQIERPEKELGSESKAASLLLWFTCETFPRDAWVSVFGL